MAENATDEAPQDEPPMETCINCGVTLDGEARCYFGTHHDQVGPLCERCYRIAKDHMAMRTTTATVMDARLQTLLSRMLREAAIQDAQQEVSNNRQGLFFYKARAEAAEAQLAQVAAALKEYGQHHEGCLSRYSLNHSMNKQSPKALRGTCTCGFDAIRQGGSK